MEEDIDRILEQLGSKQNRKLTDNEELGLKFVQLAKKFPSINAKSNEKM